MDSIKFGNISVPSVIKTLKPKNPAGWIEVPVPGFMLAQAISARRYLHGSGLSVMSSVELTDEGPDGKRPEYHISVSRIGHTGVMRATSNEARWVLDEFGFELCEEDNHVQGGIVRNFWRPVTENQVGMPCSCRDAEPEIKEDKGDYVWRAA